MKAIRCNIAKRGVVSVAVLDLLGQSATTFESTPACLVEGDASYVTKNGLGDGP